MATDKPAETTETDVEDAPVVPVKAADTTGSPGSGIGEVPATAPEPSPELVVPSPEPAAPPDLEVMAVVMSNATHGAKYPGAVVTVDAEVGRALIRAGEAVPA